MGEVETCRVRCVASVRGHSLHKRVIRTFTGKMQTIARRDLHKLMCKPKGPRPSGGRGGDKQGDPMQLLEITPESARSVTELYLGDRGLTKVHPNVMRFSNLETLWLNDNKLTEVRGLFPPKSAVTKDPSLGLRRLKQLYLSGNEISTLSGDFENLKYLETLHLANNSLRNMEAACHKLAQLKYLKQLDLFGNPLAEEAAYRLYFVFHLPSLVIFDRREITLPERQKAASIYSNAASASATHAFGSTTPAALTGTYIVYEGKRWRRIWHQSKVTNKGVFDLTSKQIAELAQAAQQVHIRTEGNAAKSVTSAVDSYPVQRLRAGRCISCLPGGRALKAEDVGKYWSGDSKLLTHLWSDPASNLDRPLATVLFYTPGNSEGLSLVSPSVGQHGSCGWTSKTSDLVEVYIDVGLEGDDKVQEMSLSVRHLQHKAEPRRDTEDSKINPLFAFSRVCSESTAQRKDADPIDPPLLQVAKIWSDESARTFRESEEKSKKAAALKVARDTFHATWCRRLGVANESVVSNDSPAVVEGKRAVAAALELLKKDTSADHVERVYKSIHEHEAPVSCLYDKLGSRTGLHAAFDDAQNPFVPKRDADCFNATYTARLRREAESIDKRESDEAVSLCFPATELRTLADSFGTGDVRTAMVPRSGLAAIIQLCMPALGADWEDPAFELDFTRLAQDAASLKPPEAATPTRPHTTGDRPDTTGTAATTHSGGRRPVSRGALPLASVLVALTRNPAFLRYKTEQARREAQRELAEGNAARAAANHQLMNRFHDLLSRCGDPRRDTPRSPSAVGSAIAKHRAVLSNSPHLAADGGRLRAAAKVAFDGEEPGDRKPTGGGPAGAKLPPAGGNSWLGGVGAGMGHVRGSQAAKQAARTAAVAALVVAARSAVRAGPPPALQPWH
eukprot:gene6774-10385_t